MSIRHWQTPQIAITTPACGKSITDFIHEDLVRELITTVNCPGCINVWEKLQVTEEGAEWHISCSECGEEFDDLAIAKAHESVMDDGEQLCLEATYEIVVA